MEALRSVLERAIPGNGAGAGANRTGHSPDPCPGPAVGCAGRGRKGTLVEGGTQGAEGRLVKRQEDLTELPPCQWGGWHGGAEIVNKPSRHAPLAAGVVK
ncbi:hypothetical protein AAFF_G00218000 [Aldrovandia affinis]|uniref:Uncharacterized protein n=1 Tax=Aldrovandia affinis TaxID=143900 RepID=A0AAD7SVX7_9TELE|nr:hypothetical protein AAFF_G00218000 [Aldrovandia affinis]